MQQHVSHKPEVEPTGIEMNALRKAETSGRPLGILDRPELVAPMLEMFTKRRLDRVKPLYVPQFESMPG